MLIFILKRVWYEKIKSGEKTIEYREVKDYWRKRFISPFLLNDDEMRDIGDSYIYDENNPAAMCKLRLGYTRKYMTARINKIEVINGLNTDLAIDKPVYAIHFLVGREYTEPLEKWHN